MGLLEQLLKQPQRGDADLGREGASGMSLPAPASGRARELFTQTGGVPLEGVPSLAGFGRCDWLGVGMGVGNLAGPSSITNSVSDIGRARWLLFASVSMFDKWNIGLSYFTERL